MKKSLLLLIVTLLVSSFQMKAQVGKVTMNFDSLQDFTFQFSPWRAVDLDTSATYGFMYFGFPHNTEKMAFIVFNPSLTTPTMDTVPAIQPHSAPRFGACFSATTPPNNDWFISPAVNLKYDGKFSVWVKSYTGSFGLEKYRVLVSVTDSSPASFIAITDTLKAPLEWTKKIFSLSAYNNQKVFVAIQCVSSDAFVFMIDDLEIDPGSTNSLPSEIVEDFEDMPDFSKDLSPWTVTDVNGGLTYGIEGVTFPHAGEPMAYIVFNPSQTTPPMSNPGVIPHSGNRFAACFASMPGHTPNNKWLISPRLHLGTSPKIGLWTETFNPNYGMEKYRIWVSTKSSNTADFVLVSGPVALEAPMNWGYKVVDLGAYADSTVYVGIQCISDNTFMFMVDDVHIGSSVGIEDQTATDPITLYPNPASDHLTVNILNPVTVSDISIMDMTGKIILKQNPDSGREEIFIDTRDLQRGIYFISIVADDQRIIRKFVVEK